jgi:hypothetical protein
MNIRLQTKEISAVDTLKAGLKDLAETANILDDCFIDAITKHRA